jgi:hypothetical protein
VPTGAGDRIGFVISTANRIAFIDLVSTDTGSECQFAYQASDYQR